MHASEVAAPHHHPRHDPVKSLTNNGQAELQNAPPQFHVPASVISSPVLPDTSARNVASADTTHEKFTSNSRHLRSSGSTETSNAFAVGPKLGWRQQCIDSDKFGIGDHLKIPITPKPRHDSFHKPSESSDGDDDGDGDEDSILELWTPIDLESRPLSCSQGIRRGSGSPDWISPNQWRTGTTVSSPSLDEAWTTAGADEPSDFDEPKYDEVKPIATPLKLHNAILETQSKGQRPYTSRLGDASFLSVPRHDYYPADQDVISDAGNQQQLHQNHTDAQESGNDDAKLELEQLCDLLPIVEGCQELQTRILDALQRTWNTQGHDQEFLPKGALCRLVNTDTVVQVLKKDLSHSHTTESIRQLAGRVCSESHVIHRGKEKIKTFRKIFALLVIAEYTSSISLFLEEDVSDLDLPLMLMKSNGKSGLCRRDPSGKPSNTLLQCFQHPKWSPIKLRNFQEYQWKLLAPFFAQDDDGDVKHYALHDHHIIPFVPPDDAEEEDVDRTGGFGKVFMVRIHGDHHNFRDKRLCRRGFAVKQQLYESDREAFKKEIVILKSFSGARSHRHIVSLLATYEQFRKFHLIFYRAEGDLFTYWKDIHTRPMLDLPSISWVAEQCAGIAEALLRLHRHLTSECQSGVAKHATFRQKEDSNQGTNEADAPGFFIDPFINRVQSCDSLEQPASPIVSERPLWPSSLSVDGERRRMKHRSPLGDHDASGVLIHNKNASIGVLKRTQKLVGFDQTTIDTEEQTHQKKYGRHGDINPGNILWYDDSDADHDGLKGTLKLADFGQAELNTLLSRTQPRDVANTLTYRPPESDLQPKIVRQSYDIWCLGCVYLEFITWVLGGKSLLLTFSRERITPDAFQNNQPTDTFFQVVRDQETEQPEVMVKKAVTLFIDELHRHPNCTDYLHDFLNMIQTEMLVVDSAQRASCADIWRWLKRMHDDCSQQEGYADERNLWSIKREPMPRSFRLKMSRHAERVIEKNLPMRHVPLARQRKVLHDIKERHKSRYLRSITRSPS
ncbi:hypothetical protein ACET3X_005889 [Alternaria dauci]|uniref:Protein kinase domain-containing protein n=1 Tax=Alternaria dauci TaxID=48095 RepID=A0ABR3UI54_9PLEO